MTTSPQDAERDAEEQVPLTAPSSHEADGNSPRASSSHSGKEAPLEEQNKPVCRICLEEDLPENLEQPCRCSGTMKHTHHSCLQRWIEEKGDMVCEICKQPFSGEYEDPPTPPPRAQHVTVWGQDYLVMADPETGTIRAHRLQGLYDEEEDEEERMNTGTAWFFTLILLSLCLLLVKHLFTLFSAEPHDGGGDGGSGHDEHHHSEDPHGRSEEDDAAFEDLSVTMLVLWLLLRLLWVIAPFYLVGRAVARVASGAHSRRGQEEDASEVELERRLDHLIQRMEAGSTPTAPAGQPMPPGAGSNGAPSQRQLNADQAPRTT